MTLTVHWRALAGIGALLLSLWQALRSVLSWGGEIDFVVSRTSDPSWIGQLFRVAATQPGYVAIALTVGGLALIYWDVKRFRRTPGVRKEPHLASPPPVPQDFPAQAAPVPPAAPMRVEGHAVDKRKFQASADAEPAFNIDPPATNLTNDTAGEWLDLFQKLAGLKPAELHWSKGRVNRYFSYWEPRAIYPSKRRPRISIALRDDGQKPYPYFYVDWTKGEKAGKYYALTETQEAAREFLRLYRERSDWDTKY